MLPLKRTSVSIWCPFRAHRLEMPNPGLKPGLKPWAELWSPFRGEICTASLMLTRMGRRQTEAKSRLVNLVKYNN